MSADDRSRLKFPLKLDRVAGTAATPQRTVLRPQRDVAAAHADARRRDPPSGLGLDSADVRRRMAQRLAEGGILEPRVLAAFAAVPRHLFVDAALATQAYEDTSLPIGHGQTISKPSVVARMISLLLAGSAARARGGLGKTLEIGTGCGYQCALLAQLADSVVSIERVRDLFDKARTHLAPMRLDRVRLVHGDGMRGHAPNAPYHSIIAAAVGDEPVQPWLDQLAIGGRLIAPVRSGSAQILAIVDRELSGFKRLDLEPVHFVPLKSGVG